MGTPYQVPQPGADPNDNRRLIQLALDSGDRDITFAGMDYHISNTYANPGDYAISALNRNNLKVTATGVRVILKWDPLNIEASLGHIFRFSNCDNLKIDGLTVAYEPSLFTQGQVSFADPGGDRKSFRFRPDPGFAFAWRTADLIGSYDPAGGRLR